MITMLMKLLTKKIMLNEKIINNEKLIFIYLFISCVSKFSKGR